MNARRESRLSELRKQVAKGLASAKSGKLADGAAVRSRLRSRLAELERARRRR